MAAEIVVEVVAEDKQQQQEDETLEKSSLSLSTTYLGLSFAVFLGLLPRSSLSLISSLQSRNRFLSLKLIQAEEQLRQMKCRRKEDSKANARVVEIFASHRNGWQQEEKKLIQQIEGSVQEISHLRARLDELEKSEAELKVCVERLEREVDERDEMINFMSRGAANDDDDEVDEGGDGYEDEHEENENDFGGGGSVGRVDFDKETGMYGDKNRGGGGYGRRFEEEEEENGEFGDHFSRFGKIRASERLVPVSEEYYVDRDGDGSEMGFLYGKQNGFIRNFVGAPVSKNCSERAGGWQDMQYDSPESLYHMKHFVARRDSPWKVDGESTGIPAKLKLLEQELLNLEKIDKGEQSKVSSSMRKQFKRYQALSGKIDDLCRRMQTNDPCEQNLGAEFRTRRQTEFLLEAYRLQQRAIETRQKLTALQTETAKSQIGEGLEAHAKLTIRRSLDSFRNNFKEIQRNLEVWLARIMGDLEGVLSREGASRAKEYYISKYPYVQ